MKRTGVFALLFFMIVLGAATPITDAKSVWSGGVQWGTAVAPRTNAYWQDDGRVPIGKPFADVAVDGVLLTSSLQSARWSLGMSDPFEDITPSTATLEFVGTISASIGDDVVITTGWGSMWAGRVDSITDTRDTTGNHWTTVNATDRIAAIGNARLRGAAGYAGTFETVAEQLMADAGLSLDVVDESDGTYGLETLRKFSTFSATFTGTVLEYIVAAARSSNAMVALQPNGSLAAMTREAPVTWPPSAVTLSGTSAPVTWSSTYTIDGNINKWSFTDPTPTELPDVTIASDIAAHGESTFDVSPYLQLDTGSGAGLSFLDWWSYVPGPRYDYSGDLIVSDFSQSDLLTLAPLDWVSESGTYSQVMSMEWSVDAPGEPMRLSLHTDDFLANL